VLSGQIVGLIQRIPQPKGWQTDHKDA